MYFAAFLPSFSFCRLEVHKHFARACNVALLAKSRLQIQRQLTHINGERLNDQFPETSPATHLPSSEQPTHGEFLCDFCSVRCSTKLVCTQLCPYGTIAHHHCKHTERQTLASDGARQYQRNMAGSLSLSLERYARYN